MIARSLIVISTLGLIFSCAPKDQKVNRPFDPTKAGPAGAVNSAEAKADNYRYLVMLVERQIEVIHLFKILTDSDYAAKKMYKLEDVQIDSVNYKKLSASVSITTQLNTIKNTTSLLAQIQLDDSKSVQKIVITEDKVNLSVDSISKNQDQPELVLKNKIKKIVITKANEEGSFDVTFESLDESNTKIGKTLMLNNLKFNFSKLAETNNFKINSVELNHSRYGMQTSDFAMKSTQVDLIVQLNDQCSSYTGQLFLSSLELDKSGSKALYTRDLTVNDSSMILKAGKDTYDLKAASCEERPVVDLSKLL